MSHRQLHVPAVPVSAREGFESQLVPYAAVQELPATSVLVLAPHPDDEVLGCGGAIMRHAELGHDVRVIVVTDGALGLAPAERADHIERRRTESRRAAGVLGYGEPEFWDLPDQGISYGETLVEAIRQAIGAADLVYAPSLFEIHPDHRAVGMAAVEAARRHGGVRVALYEVGAPLRPNLLLDISRSSQRKQAALQCFSSQLGRQRYDLHIEALNRYRTYTLGPEVTAAEAFLLLQPSDLEAGAWGVYSSEHETQRSAGALLAEALKPLVTVIVRSRDRPTLGEALNSLASQTYANIEVVVVDAVGKHREVPPDCGAFPLRMVTAGEPLSRGRAANLGLDAARGDLLILLDDDDLFLPDHVSRLVAALDATDGVQAAYAGVKVETDSGVIDIYDHVFTKAALKAWNRLPVHSVLFARSLLEAGCRFDEELEVYEDWDFWLQVAEHTGFAHRPGISAIYRVHLGTSGLHGPGSEQTQQAGRAKVHAKWLKIWRPQDLAELSAELREAQHRADEARSLEGFLSEARAKVRELDQIVRARDTYILELHADTTREALEGFLSEERAKVAELGRIITARDAYILELQAKSQEQAAQIARSLGPTTRRASGPLRAMARLARGLLRRGG